MGKPRRREARPSVTVNPIADRHSISKERIIEFGTKAHGGGFISFRERADGHLQVEVYGTDPTVDVTAPAVNIQTDPNVAALLESARAVLLILKGRGESGFGYGTDDLTIGRLRKAVASFPLDATSPAA